MAEEIKNIVDNSFDEGEDFEEIDDFESEEFEEDTIYCQYCQMGFTDFDEWKAHEEEEATRSGTVEINAENEPLVADDAGKEEIFCQYCQKGFTDFDEWKLHEEDEARSVNKISTDNLDVSQTNVDEMGDSLAEIHTDFEEKLEENDLNKVEANNSDTNLYMPQPHFNEINDGIVDNFTDAKSEFDETKIIVEEEAKTIAQSEVYNYENHVPHINKATISDDLSQVQMTNLVNDINSGITSAVDLTHIDDTEDIMTDDLEVTGNSFVESELTAHKNENNLSDFQTDTGDNIGTCDGNMAKEEPETNCVSNTEVKSLVREENNDADMFHEIEDNSDTDLAVNDLDDWDITDNADMNKEKMEEVQTNFDGSLAEASVESSQTHVNFNDQNLPMENAEFEKESEMHVDGGSRDTKEIDKSDDYNLDNNPVVAQKKDEDKIFCQYCEREFTNFDEWKAHEEEEAKSLMETYNLSNIENKVENTKTSNEEEIYCQYCRQAFSDFDEWKLHEDEERKSLEHSQPNQNNTIYCQHCEKPFSDFNEWKLHEEEEGKIIEWKLREEEERKMVDSSSFASNVEMPLMNNSNALPEIETRMVNNSSLAADSERSVINNLNAAPDMESPMTNSSSLAQDMDRPMMNNTNPTSDIPRPMMSSTNPASDIQRPMMNSTNATSDIQRPVMNNPNPASDVQRPMMNSTNPAPIKEKTEMNSSSSAADMQRPKMTSPNIENDIEKPMMNGSGVQPGMPRPVINSSGFHPGMPRPMVNNPGFHPGMPRPMMNNPGFHPGMPRPMMNSSAFAPGMPRHMMNNPGFHPGMPRPMMNNSGFAPGMQRPMMNSSNPEFNSSELINKRQMSQEEVENKPDMKRLKSNPFHCKQCPNTYENKESMQRHLKYHTTGGPPHILTQQQIGILNNYYYNKAKIPTDDLLLEMSQVLNIESHEYIQSWFRSKMNLSPTKNERKPPISIPSSIQVSRVSSETHKIDEKSADDEMKNNYVSRSFSKKQLEIMWSYFNRLDANNEKLTYSFRDEIARKTSLSPNSIASWFTYQRKRKASLTRANNPQMALTGSINSQSSPTSKSKSQTMSRNPELNEKIRKHNAIGDRLSSLMDQVEKFKKGLDAARNNLEERINLNDSGFDEKNNSHNSSLEDVNPKQNLPNSSQNQPNGFPNPPNAPNGMFINPNMPFHPMMYGFPPNAPPQFAQSGPPQFSKNGPPQFPPNGPHFAPQGHPQFPPNMPPQFLPRAPPQYFPNMPGPHGNMLPQGNVPPQGNLPPHMPPQFNQNSSNGFSQVPFNGIIPKQEPQIKQEQQ